MQIKNDFVRCDQIFVGSRGWPFPTTNVYSNGSEKAVQAEESTCFKCAEQSFGSQKIYNALILSAVYWALLTVGVKAFQVQRKTKPIQKN